MEKADSRKIITSLVVEEKAFTVRFFCEVKMQDLPVISRCFRINRLSVDSFDHNAI
jgi:hypothetical protein